MNLQKLHLTKFKHQQNVSIIKPHTIMRMGLFICKVTYSRLFKVK